MRSYNKFSFLPILLLLIGLGTIAITILSPRDLSLGEDKLFEEVQLNLIGDNVSRVLTAIILALSGLKIFSVIIKGKIPSGGSGLLFSYLIFFFLATFITALFAKNGGFSIQLLYVPIVLTAVYVTRPMASVSLISLSKFILLIYIYGSLFAAVFASEMALIGNYEGLIPGLTTRLFGVSTHANHLGPFAVIYLAMEFLNPMRSKLRLIHLTAGWAVLIWAQSKTAWGFALLATLYFVSTKIESALFLRSTSKRQHKKFIRLALWLAGIILIFAMYSGPTNIAPTSSGGSVETLTGRTTIWTITLDAWATSPIFGYGLSLWDLDFRTKYGMPFAGQAHNQFIHTLGSSGLVGLIGLLIYLSALTKRALNIEKVNPVALVLLSFIIFDSITEIPLHNGGVMNGFFFIHLILFAQLRSIE